LCLFYGFHLYPMIRWGYQNWTLWGQLDGEGLSLQGECMKIYNLACNCYEGTFCFSWKMEGTSGQKSYRIVVADENGVTAWDSGVVERKERHNIPCGVELENGLRYTYMITVTDEAGETDTGIGNAFDTPIKKWGAKWIEPDRMRKDYQDCRNPHEHIEVIDPLLRLDPVVYMRKEFELEEEVKKADVYITAHGIYGLWINGTLVSDFLAPGYTSYAMRLEYQCIDIADYLVKGTNVIAALVADGWYTGKVGAVGCGKQYGEESALLFQVEAMMTSGAELTICSDESAKWTEGAYRYADLFIGEYYDANLEMEGWMKAGFDDSDWKAVKVVDYGFDNLTIQTIPPVRVAKRIVPKLIVTPEGDMLLDAGEVTVGVVRFTLKLKKGQTVKLGHTETLTKEGNFLVNIIGHNKDQSVIYVSASDGEQTYQPRFTYHGFRYVRIIGLDEVNPENFEIQVLETPKDLAGYFTCSDERLNQLEENTLRSQQGNMIWIPTDCPQREKTGWTGDAQIYAPTACYKEDVESFYRHWLVDMRHEQLSDGQIPHIIPYIPSHDYMKPPGIEGVSAAGWSDAAVIIPWRLYEAYGDKEILRENFDMMKKYMESVIVMASEIPGGLEDASPEVIERQKYLWNTGFQYGDWLMPSIVMSGKPIFEVVKETGHIVASFMFAITSRMMAQICEALDEKEEAAKYWDLNAKIKQAVLDEYINEDGTIKKDFQGVYVLALYADIVPENRKSRTIERLEELIAANNGLLDTGFLSVAYLLPVLATNGKKNLANQLLFNDRCPSWLYEVKMGATTMWEYWNGYKEDGTPDECSMNHFSFGCVSEYLYRSILGIDFAEPGFGKVRIQPDIDCGLEFAKGYYECIWGRIEVEWKLNGNEAELTVVLPPNVEAELVLGSEKAICGCGTKTLKTAR